jgi:hypothetical protein
MQHYSQLRFYAFTNFYISSIQHGIQTGHASVDLVQKYKREYENAVNSDNDHMKAARLQVARDNLRVVEDWANNHKTYVILNGGEDADINAAYELLSKTGFPFVDFREPGLGNIRTCAGVLLPDSIFDMKRAMLRTEWEPNGYPIYRHEGTNTTIAPNDKLYAFMEYYKGCGLAR